MSIATLTRSAFMAIPTPEVETHYIEEVGCDVCFKQMTAQELDSYDWSLVKFEIDKETGIENITRRTDNTKAKYLVRCLCDADGVRLFTDDEYLLLGQKPPKVINALHKKAQEVNGIIAGKPAEKNLDTEK